MTEQELRKQPVNYLKKYLGVKEGTSGHKDILNLFNNSGLCTRYKMTGKDAWCATAVSSAFIANGMAGKPGSGKLFQCVECSCAKMIDLAKKQGIWQESDSYAPKVGDVIMYDWQDSGSGDNTGNPDHVGIVAEIVDGSTFKVIEGNKNDAVEYRTMKVNGKYIRGYVVPKYSNHATTTSTATSSASKSITQIAKEVLDGKWGNGETRKTKLKNAGYDVNEVQAEVNRLSGKSTTTKPTNTTSTSATKTVTASKMPVSHSSSLEGTYKTTANLHLRSGAGTGYKSLYLIPQGTSVKNYGYYTSVNGTKWLWVQFTAGGVKYTGFSHSGYLKKN